MIRRLFNDFLQSRAQRWPGCTSVRPFLHRLRGVNILDKVFIGRDVVLDRDWPQNITLHRGAQLVDGTKVLCHFRGPGKIIIEEDVWIGPNCIITAHNKQTVTVGRGAMIAANSTVTNDIPAMTFCAGNPAKPIKRETVPMTLRTSYEEWQAGLRPLKEE
jgi:acetyltransferase-like isoleucine patch superfamily enzyme